MTQERLSEGELVSQLEAAHKVVEIGGVYAHYRDSESRYKVISLAIIEATQEVGVIYQKADAPMSWIRPISSWLEKIFIWNIFVQRFQLVTTAQLDLKEW